MKEQKILIVEDETSLTKILKSKLEKEGYAVLSAINGEKGLDMALKEKPDLILLDIVMPRMDGYEMLNKLRKDTWGKNVPVIILTNLTEPKEISNGVSMDIKDYLVKTDWSLNEVINKVKKRLEK
ncbi:MAG: response regulator [Candidatus Magasanikbacteria bacterium]|nr:response regulator [Candidatus Magasanikbacteria bacterium]